MLELKHLILERHNSAYNRRSRKKILLALNLEHHFLPMQKGDSIPEGRNSPVFLPLLCSDSQGGTSHLASLSF